MRTPVWKLVALATLLVASSSAPAQDAVGPPRSPLWGGIEPGPYAVGFEVRHTVDRSRSFQPKRDLEGRIRSLERHRPVQISLWYPARPGQGGAPLTFAEYLGLAESELDPQPAAVAQLAVQREQFIAQHTANGASRKALEEMLAKPAAAVRDAAPAPGPFPLVVFGQGFSGSSWMSFLLGEYLASHGYVFATSPSVGPTSRAMVAGYPGLETQVRDLEYLIGQLAELPSVDRDRLAVAGFSFGGAAALMVALRNSEVDAVVSLDGSDGFANIVPLIRHWPQFVPARMTAAYLRLGQASPPQLDLSLVESLLYSHRYLAGFPRLRHTDFVSNGMLDALVPGFTGLSPGDTRLAAELVCRAVVLFLDGQVKGDAAALERLAALERWDGVPGGFVTLSIHDALPAPPAEELLVEMVLARGARAAAERVRQARKADPGLVPFTEETMNRVGYQLLGAGRTKDAVEVLKLVVEVFPESWNAHDSLGEAYARAGAREFAVRSYQRSLDLNPSNDNARRKLEQLKAP